MHIDLFRAPSPWVTPVESPVSEIENNKGRDTDVCGEKAADRPLGGEENCEAIDEQHEYGTCQAEIRAIGLQPRFVRLLDPLRFHGFAEPEKHDAAANPGDKAGGIGKVHEPVEDNRAGVADSKVGQCREARRHSDSIVWNSPSVA